MRYGEKASPAPIQPQNPSAVLRFFGLVIVIGSATGVGPFIYTLF